MDDDLGQEQQLLLDASTRLIEEACPLTRVRAGAFDEPGFAERYWRKAGELGWFALAVPESAGGGSVSGNGVMDAALVAYRRGRSLQPGPFVGTNVVAHAVATHGSDEQRERVLPGLLAGEAMGALVLAGPSGAPVLGGAIAARASGSGFRLSGTAALVEAVGPSGWLLVAVATDGGPTVLLVPASGPGVRLAARGSLDLSRRLVEVTFDGAEVPASAAVGAVGGGAEVLGSLLALASTLLVAESVGAMDREFDFTVQYAKDRIAFGRPIGSFQGIKHQLADTSLALEMAKAVATAAADHVGTGSGYANEAASIAKAFVADAGIDLAQTCFQVFGGIGFTWEHDQHLFLRRLTSDAALYGDASWHRTHLVRLAGVSAGAGR